MSPIRRNSLPFHDEILITKYPTNDAVDINSLSPLTALIKVLLI